MVLQLHDAFAKTELFAEEIDKLIPHMAEGTTNYIKMMLTTNTTQS